MRAAPNGTRNRALGDVIRNQLPGSPRGHSFESFRLEAEQQTHRASSKMHEERERGGEGKLRSHCKKSREVGEERVEGF